MRHFRTAIVVLVALMLIALTEMGRTAVNRAYDYREMTAPKSLHQLTLETRADEDGRGGIMLFGAGLFALALLTFGGMVFAMNGGREFGRGIARKRRRDRSAARPSDGARPVELPAMRQLPRAPILPSLPPTSEGRYEDQS